MIPYFTSAKGDFELYAGDSRQIIPALPDKSFDMVFADPPYFLSNGGFSIQSGKCVSVDKGTWDKSSGRIADGEFNYQWIKACREKMTDAATIWVCGTFHNIFSIACILEELDFRLLNSIVWQKKNPPPNLSCRFFTHSTEILLWARKCRKVPHRYNYDLMHRLAGGHQMTDVWTMPAIAKWEKSCGKHPTQKPLALVVRAILSCTTEGNRILDPFAGSSTTGIAANMLRRRFVGIEKEKTFLALSKHRRMEYGTGVDEWARHIEDLRFLRDQQNQGKEKTVR